MLLVLPLRWLLLLLLLLLVLACTRWWQRAHASVTQGTLVAGLWLAGPPCTHPPPRLPSPGHACAFRSTPAARLGTTKSTQPQRTREGAAAAEVDMCVCVCVGGGGRTLWRWGLAVLRLRLRLDEGGALTVVGLLLLWRRRHRHLHRRCARQHGDVDSWEHDTCGGHNLPVPPLREHLDELLRRRLRCVNSDGHFDVQVGDEGPIGDKDLCSKCNDDAMGRNKTGTVYAHVSTRWNETSRGTGAER